MSVTLFWQKPINLTFYQKDSLVGIKLRKAEELVQVLPDDVATFKTGDASQSQHILTSLRDLLERNKPSIEKGLLNIGFWVPIEEDEKSWLFVRLEGELLQEIENLFGLGTRFQLQLVDLKMQISIQARFNLVKRDRMPLDVLVFGPTSEMMVSSVESDPSQAFCLGDITLPHKWMDMWCNMSDEYEYLNFSGKMNLILTVFQPISPILTCSTNGETAKRLLDEQVGSDVEIVAGNGVGVKCHSAFLSVHSEVLKTMLNSEMKQSSTMKIEISDVREEGLRAFLAYLYCGDMSKSLESCSVTVELFQLGHRYLVGSLEESMKNILLEKPYVWFDVDPTLCLFFFAGKLDKHKDLRNKATRLLKSKPNDLLACQEYQRLFEEENNGEVGLVDNGTKLQAAKELFQAMLSSSI